MNAKTLIPVALVAAALWVLWRRQCACATATRVAPAATPVGAMGDLSRVQGANYGDAFGLSGLPLAPAVNWVGNVLGVEAPAANNTGINP